MRRDVGIADHEGEFSGAGATKPLRKRPPTAVRDDDFIGAYAEFDGNDGFQGEKASTVRQAKRMFYGRSALRPNEPTRAWGNT